MICSFTECGRRHYAKRLCNGHYKQQCSGGQLRPLRHKSPNGILHTLESLLTRTAQHDDCLFWMDAQNGYGYGTTWHSGEQWASHRLSYFLSCGEHPGSSIVHHKCANRLCIRPDHLQLVSHVDNVAEMFARKDYEARIRALEAKVKELQARLTLNEEVQVT